ncbi:MAG: polysaccharide biosynthesis C-terminal domain-containing protein [Candidatus Tectomicrobia bacterium]|uniref:Polysaccharide biosynthesis C-terminal domain-containing protein n=1 Tax=Tectimicrobiota bacterium TaxID=2528274 RepID=A0A932LZZ7_UNCTE|nr:polysaccharide biosynthesis C-terminal domain-containing protein [Candidatus Tectomicrobia bacterium]
MEEAAAIQTQLAASEVTEGKIIRTAWRQAWPMTVAQFASAAYTLVDMFFVGKLGRDAIAAVALGGIVDNVSWIIMTGVVIANKVFISREIGAGRWKEAAHSSYQSLLFGFVLSLFVAIPCFFLARETLIVMGAQGEVVTQGLGYLQILSLGVLVSFQVQVARSIFEAVGDPKIPMKILVVSNILNAILAPALIWGVGIIPALGVNGAALAVVLARLFALGWFMILLRRRLRPYLPVHATGSPPLPSEGRGSDLRDASHENCSRLRHRRLGRLRGGSAN